MPSPSAQTHMSTLQALHTETTHKQQAHRSSVLVTSMSHTHPRGDNMPGCQPAHPMPILDMQPTQRFINTHTSSEGMCNLLYKQHVRNVLIKQYQHHKHPRTTQTQVPTWSNQTKHSTTTQNIPISHHNMSKVTLCCSIEQVQHSNTSFTNKRISDTQPTHGHNS